MPLSHPPGRAQCDFGEALVVVSGVERKAHRFVIDLPHSGGGFVKAYPAETTEAFLDGVPRTILYDNTRLAVARILGDKRTVGGTGSSRASTSSVAWGPLASLGNGIR